MTHDPLPFPGRRPSRPPIIAFFAADSDEMQSGRIGDEIFSVHDEEVEDVRGLVQLPHLIFKTKYLFELINY